MKSVKARIYAWISDRYMHDCSNYNTLEVRKSCRSKAQDRAVFAAHGLPHARGEKFILPWSAHKFATRYGFPLVIKPNVSGYSRGSYFPINSYGELWKATLRAKRWWPTTMVEEYLEGANYRVLATDEKLVSVIRRYPPFVTGNGRDTIDTLIDAENQVREEMSLYPVMHPLEKDESVKAHLKKQGLGLESVPADGQYVELFHRVALAPGGVVEIVDRATIPEQNREFFYNVVRAFGANVFGIDVIFEKGIEVPYTEQKCILVEVNSRPYIAMHHFPRYGKKEDFSADLAELDKLEIADKDIF
mgnify:CR=1 FL=1